jgi:hypothetical protein
MFAKTIVDSDAFMDMPLSTQALYFHIGMRADDDGFVNNPRKIQRMIGASDDDLKLLIAKKFLITFASGVVCVKHWKMNNYIRSDRYNPTVYEEEKAQLILKENGAYTLDSNLGIPLGIPNDNQRYPQDRIGKDRIGKDNNSIYLSAPDEEEEDEFSTGFSTEFSTSEERERLKTKIQHGELFQGKVVLSDAQMDDLLDKLSFDEFNHYVGVIVNRIDIGKPFKRKTHYQAILDMATQDRKLR